MRILCDQNVARKYVEALERTDDVTVNTVEEVLEHDARDTEIAAYAERNDWVVFTNDDDFFVAGGEHGLLLYDQLDDPSPGNVVTAIRRISTAYSDSKQITENVPGGWLS